MPLFGSSEIVLENRVRTTSGGPAPATKRHPNFYFDESPVIIKVEDTLFKVHKYQLLESETFSDMFKMPKGTSNEVEEGSSPECPIALDGLSASDFEALLTVLYARRFSDDHPSLEASLIVPAFRLAHMWNFAGLRKHLLPLAEKVLGDIDKIVLARELGVQEWLVPAYVKLCQRPEPLNIEEATKLGIHSLLMIYNMREQFRPPKLPTSSGPVLQYYYCSGCAIDGAIYVGSCGCSCRNCGSSAVYRVNSNGVGPSEHNNLETQVKKWVEAGCVFEK